jgi:threonine dehydrogenase-like Zn-dependent dehydrogenase
MYQDVKTGTNESSTQGLVLYKALQLPLPTQPAEEPFPILIHGGSTSTGMWAIQYAKASGLTVIATASPRNFDYLKSLGADAVFDYRSPTAGAEIRALTGNRLKHALDCAGGGEMLCAQALTDAEPSKLAELNAPNQAAAELAAKENPLVQTGFTAVAYDILDEPFEYGGQMFYADKDTVEYAQMFKKMGLELLASGKTRFVKTSLNRGGSGLEGIMFGMNEMRTGRVSGEKLVYTL